MDIKRILKIIILYFLPMIVMHMIFAMKDLNIQNQSIDIETMFQERRNIVNAAVYFYFIIEPLYLVMINVISHIKKNHELYTKDIKFMYLSIFFANLSVCVFNINNADKFLQSVINPISEFFIIFVTQGITLGMLNFIGFVLIKNKMKMDTEEDV